MLVRGESGTGKEQVARRLHRGGPRAAGPFVAVNCAAIPAPLLEAEMFGAVRGAYTGSERDRPGLFRQASGGVLLLDEVGDMPLALQSALLRALQEKCVRPIGATRELPIDARVVSATHRDLVAEVAAGRFRADLYFRLAVLTIDVAPLRERLDELDTLIAALTPRVERETGERFGGLSRNARRAVERHRWPGNIRELHAVLAAATLRAGGRPIEPAHLGLAEASERAPSGRGLEYDLILHSLAANRGNVAATARAIGWTRQRLYRRMLRHGVARGG